MARQRGGLATAVETPTSTVPADDARIREQAALEKTLRAEQATGWVRVLVVALASAIYYPLMPKTPGTLPLAVAITFFAASYGLVNAIWMPYRRFPVMRSAAFISVLDAALILLWVYATGGYASPFYVIWYVSLVAVAFRFSPRTTMIVTAGYAAAYALLLLALGQLEPNLAGVLVRIGHIFLVGIVGALLSRETLQQAEEKVTMRQLMLEARAANQRLAARERDLRGTVAVLDATLNSTADGILVVDDHGRVLSYNRRFLEVWNIPAELARRANDEELLRFVQDQLAEPEQFRSGVEKIYRDGGEQTMDELRFKDGRIIERYSQPQHIEGRATGRVWSFRDVTAARSSEEERVRNMERAKELQRLRDLDEFKTRFINQIAHEIWTPLTPIKLQLHLMRQRGETRFSPEDVRSLALIDRNMDRLQQLVEEMLDGARLQAGRFRVHQVPMRLDPVIHDVLLLFEPMAQEARIRLTRDVQTNLFVSGDANRLTQVLYNLLSNAHKFTASGGQVHLQARREADRVLVSVTDNGIGLTGDQLSRLFQPFSQAHDVMQWTKSGTGLGLYISRAIVEAHGGRIEAHSEGAGRGSRFEFWLPHVPTPQGLDAPQPMAAADPALAPAQ